MDSGKLVKMANAIANFFESDPNREVMLNGIASHLERFWEPRMREALLRAIDLDEGVVELKDSVKEAVARRRAQWEHSFAARRDAASSQR